MATGGKEALAAAVKATKAAPPPPPPPASGAKPAEDIDHKIERLTKERDLLLLQLELNTLRVRAAQLPDRKEL